MASLAQQMLVAAPATSSLEATRTSFLGAAKSVSVPAVRKVVAGAKVTCSAEKEVSVSRRDAVLLATLAAVGVAAPRPALASYGEAANVFGSKPANDGTIPFDADGFKLKLPAKWNPSKERDFSGVVLRWEDNSDSLTHVAVVKVPSGKKSVTEYGSLEQFAQDNAALLGEQVFDKSVAEGGFDKGKVSKAAFLATAVEKDSKGRSYYKYEVLTTTADGTEGGRHVLVTAAVDNGNLYICKITAGDKRWFKGAERVARSLDKSFQLA